MNSYWNTFRMAAWLGWQIESNWTDPFLFAIYSLVKPLAGAAILVVMYGVITQGAYQDPLFTYMYLGNAFYIYVGQIMNGLAFAIIDEREHYKMLKYMFIAPIHYPTFLLGRGTASFIVGSISMLITLLAGFLFLGIRINPAAVNWPLLLAAMLLGINMLTLLGLILAGALLTLVNHMWEAGAAVAGAMFLFSGAVFPLEVLPASVRPIGYLLPITYWLELVRRALVGGVAQAYPTFNEFSNTQLLAILLGLTLLLALIASFSFKWCEHRAKERGLLDMVSNY